MTVTDSISCLPFKCLYTNTVDTQQLVMPAEPCLTSRGQAAVQNNNVCLYIKQVFFFQKRFGLEYMLRL